MFVVTFDTLSRLYSGKTFLFTPFTHPILSLPVIFLSNNRKKKKIRKKKKKIQKFLCVVLWDFSFIKHKITLFYSSSLRYFYIYSTSWKIPYSLDNKKKSIKIKYKFFSNIYLPIITKSQKIHKKCLDENSSSSLPKKGVYPLSVFFKLKSKLVFCFSKKFCLF